MFVDKIFEHINRSKLHRYYFLSPHAYAIGNCAEEIYYGLLKARRVGKKLIILSIFDLPFILRYKFPNRALLRIQSEYIYNVPKIFIYITMLSLTMIYVPLRLFSLITRKFFNYRLPESYSFPRIGINDLYMPSEIKHRFSWDLVEAMEWKNQFNSKIPVSLEENDIHYCEKLLNKMGVGEEDWFVCLHVRESGFRNDKGRREYRNSDIFNYIPAIKEITNRGGWLMRMGDKTMKPLPPMERVIDYPFTEFKSQLMDIFLIHRCKFNIGCQSGIFDVAKLFNKKTLLTNMYLWTFGGPFRSFDRGITKNYYSKYEGNYLTVSDLVNGGWELQNLNGVINSNYIIEENTPEQLTESIIEYMHLVRQNNFLPSELQKEASECIINRAKKIVCENRLASKNLMNDDEEILEKYRIASQAIGSSGKLSNSQLKNYSE